MIMEAGSHEWLYDVDGLRDSVVHNKLTYYYRNTSRNGK
jgi:hypothetical protein